MQNPFSDDYENSRDTDRFITSVYVQRQDQIQKTPVYSYILVGMIYLLEILTTILGGMNSDKNNGLFHSDFNLQYWLMISGIYSIVSMMVIYQFNQKVYKNKIYFIILDFIKLSWILIGIVMLFGFNIIIGCNFIIGYSLFYILFSIIYLSITFTKTIKMSNSYYDYY